MPEALRIYGELLTQSNPSDLEPAEVCFTRSLAFARRQGALSWELRAATSLARLLEDEGRPADAIELLQPVYDRFTEGFETADLKVAKAFLEALQ
jgi:predicted ATPase